MKNLNASLPGVALAGVIALLATELCNIRWLQENGISALTMAIILGIVIGNSVYPRIAAGSGPGVQFSKQTLLRLGIVLYGIRLTFQDIRHVGIGGVIIDTIVVCSTFAIAWFLGTRWLGLDRKTAMLIGAGSSICGAAAVMATEPVVRGRADQVTVAVSTVVVFGTVAIFLYPVLYRLNVFGFSSPAAYGLFAGSTIHEVAQVVAAGRAIGEQAAATAVITKMVRVMLLAPFLLGLSVYLSRESQSGEARRPGPAADAAASPANGSAEGATRGGAHGVAASAAQGTVVSVAEGTVVGQGEDTVVGQGEDTVVGQGEDTVFGQGEDTVFGQGKGTVVGQGKGTVFGQGKGTVFGQGEGTVFGQGKGTGAAEATFISTAGGTAVVAAVGERPGMGARIAIPWFALGFVAVTALNSVVSLPTQLTAIATTFDTFVLAMAMAALGLTTHVSAIRNAGIRPLALAGVLFAWLIAGGAAINAGVSALLG